MTDATLDRSELSRQVAHWSMAAYRLQKLEDLASPDAWDGLETYLGVTVRKTLERTAERLERRAAALRAALAGARTRTDLEGVGRQLIAFRRHYLRTETTLDFYADAINTRTNPKIAALLRACDALAYRSMAQALEPLNKPVPVVLTSLDKGLGARILKAGLRLWDGGTVSPAAAISIVRHNLLRPTSLIHEAGHQVAHILGWNDELAAALENGLAGDSQEVADAWAGWASEIAADAFAFVHTGYAAVASLHDVLAGGDRFVFRYLPGDPHPISFVRVLLGTAMCRRFFQAGPWDRLAAAWMRSHPPEQAGSGTRQLLQASIPLLPRIVEITLRRPMRAFDGRPLAALIRPERVSPAALNELRRRLGPALYTSTHWLWTESVRLLALTGLQIATSPERAKELFERQEAWMLGLGGVLRAA